MEAQGIGCPAGRVVALSQQQEKRAGEPMSRCIRCQRPYVHDPVFNLWGFCTVDTILLTLKMKKLKLGKHDKTTLFIELSLALHLLSFPLHQAAGRAWAQSDCVSWFNPHIPGANGRAPILLTDTHAVGSSTSSFPRRLGQVIRLCSVTRSLSRKKRIRSCLFIDVISLVDSTAVIPVI